MPDKDLDTANVSPEEIERKDWPTVGARVHPTKDLPLVDAAAAQKGQKRASFVYDAVMEVTRRTLGITVPA